MTLRTPRKLTRFAARVLRPVSHPFSRNRALVTSSKDASKASSEIQRFSAAAWHAESPYVFSERVLRETPADEAEADLRLRSPTYFTCNSSISKIRVRFALVGPSPAVRSV